MSRAVSNDPLLQLTGVSKHFGGVVALQGIELDIRCGEVHALVGENGAGKSTLGKLLVGVHTPTAGTVQLQDSPKVITTPARALKLGLVGISQELSLMPQRSVVDNVMLAREITSGLWVDATANRDAVLAVMLQYDIHVDPDARVDSLSVTDQQKVEILRALSRDAKLIVFDEPTARLPSDQAKHIRTVVQRLAKAGKAVVYVSHFLEEVLAVADTITVLRNGQMVYSGTAKDQTRQSLIQHMTGASLNQQFPVIPAPSADAPVALQVRQLRLVGNDSRLNLDIQAGEVVGLSGLVGSGRSEIAHALLGATAVESGSITLFGEPIAQCSIADRILRGVALIPENRRDQGLMMNRPIQENVGLPYLSRLVSWFGLNIVQDRRNAELNCTRATVKYRNLSDSVTTLSGGNQQKVLFARASLGNARLLIVDEPTRGVDVGAKRKIYDLIAEIAGSGAAVLLVSSEIEEIIGLCHRVAVVSLGRIAGEYSGEQINHETLINAAFSEV